MNLITQYGLCGLVLRLIRDKEWIRVWVDFVLQNLALPCMCQKLRRPHETAHARSYAEYGRETSSSAYLPQASM